MHGYVTFNIPYRGHRFAAVTRCVLPGPRTSIVRANYFRETSVERRNKVVQEITLNVANIFIFSCNNSDRTWFFNALTFTRSLGRCWKPRPSASVFDISLGTGRMLMHVKPCLIPIILLFFIHVNWKRLIKTWACSVIRRDKTSVHFYKQYSKEWINSKHLYIIRISFIFI